MFVPTQQKISKIGLNHLSFLTDDFSIWQHTHGEKINEKFGYALDDGARALLVALSFKDFEKKKIYLNFLGKALSSSKIINFFNSERQPIDTQWSEDALGEAYWSLSECLFTNFFRIKAEKIISDINPKIFKFTTPRGISYALLGAVKADRTLANRFSNNLLGLLSKNGTENWFWPEQRLSYANAIIPFSILSSAQTLKRKDLERAGIKTLDFLNEITKEGGRPIVIGNNGWCKRGCKKALFDQQPIDAGYQVLANIKAFELTRDSLYLNEAKEYFLWFWGNNLIGKALVDTEKEGCRDGFSERRRSPNRGAESIICYLLAQEAIWPYLK